MYSLLSSCFKMASQRAKWRQLLYTVAYRILKDGTWALVLSRKPSVHHHPHLSRRQGDRRVTTDIATLSLHLILFSASLRALKISTPSTQRYYSPNASFVFPFFSLCKIVLASPDDLDACPRHFNLRFCTVFKISS